MSTGTASVRPGALSTETESPTRSEYALAGVYPQSWDAYIGQARAKEQMMDAVQAAKAHGQPLDHTLIASGVPGIGKTSLALLAADAMGCQIRVVAQQIKATEARMIFSDLVDGDVLVIEEIHQLVKASKRDAEWLIHYLENGVLISQLGIEEVPRVTVIGTTTEAGLLPQTVLDRFTVRPSLTEYTRDEAAQIAAGFFHRMWADSAARGVDLPAASPANCFEIADAASGNPRIMRQLIKNLNTKATVSTSLHDGEGFDVSQVLASCGVTADGLDDLAQRYLLCLLDTFRGEPAGESAIKQRLREPGGLGYTETLLERKGFVSFTKRGRLLSMAGVKRAKQLRGA